MESLLQSVFGGQQGTDPSQQAQDFVGRYEQGAPWTNFSGQEAAQRYQQVAPTLSPADFQQAASQAFSRMDPGQRSQFAQLLANQTGQGVSQFSSDPAGLAQAATQLHQQSPGGLAALFGGGSGVGGLLGGGQGSGSGGMGELLNNPLAKAALGGIAAMALKQMMDHR